MSQVQDLQINYVRNSYRGDGFELNFLAATISEKLPPARKDFKSYLKHKRKEISLDDLIIKIHVKEGNKNNYKKSVISVAKANFVEYSQNNKNKKAT